MVNLKQNKSLANLHSQKSVRALGTLVKRQFFDRRDFDSFRSTLGFFSVLSHNSWDESLITLMLYLCRDFFSQLGVSNPKETPFGPHQLLLLLTKPQILGMSDSKATWFALKALPKAPEFLFQTSLTELRRMPSVIWRRPFPLSPQGNSKLKRGPKKRKPELRPPVEWLWTLNRGPHCGSDCECTPRPSILIQFRSTERNL